MDWDDVPFGALVGRDFTAYPPYRMYLGSWRETEVAGVLAIDIEVIDLHDGFRYSWVAGIHGRPFEYVRPLDMA